METEPTLDKSRRIASDLGFYDASQDSYEVVEREDLRWPITRLLALGGLTKVIKSGES